MFPVCKNGIRTIQTILQRSSQDNLESILGPNEWIPNNATESEQIVFAEKVKEVDISYISSPEVIEAILRKYCKSIRE